MAREEIEQRLMEECDRRIDMLRAEMERFIISSLQRASEKGNINDVRLHDVVTTRETSDNDPFVESATIIVNDALRGILVRGEINPRRLGGTVAQRVGGALGRQFSDVLFDNTQNGVRMGGNQLGSRLLDGLFKSQRNR